MRSPWLMRGAWIALLALLLCQALLGVRAEVGRALDVPLAQRAAALGSGTDARYRALLGSDAPLLYAVRAQARPDTRVVLVHAGTPESTRVVAVLTGLLFPAPVIDVARPPETRHDVMPPPAGDVLLVLIGEQPGLAGTLASAGWHAQTADVRWQLWSALPVPASAVTPQSAGTSPATAAPPPPSPRMAAWRLALLVVLPLLSGALWLRAFTIRPRDEPLAFWGWAWMTGCVWIGLVLFGWLSCGASLWSLGPPAWALLALAPPALLGTWTARRRDALADGTGTHAAATTATRPAAAPPTSAPPASELPSAALATSASSTAPPSTVVNPRAAPPAPARWERLLFAGCVAFALMLLADRIVLAGSRVVAGGDEGTIWAAKAKALWQAGGFNERYAELAQRTSGIWHQDYPPLNPLLQVFAGQIAGRPLDFENRLPIQLFLPAIVLVLAGALRRATRPAVAALLLLVFVTCRTTIEAADVAHADSLLAGGLLMLLEALRRRRGDASWRWLALAGTAATLLAFSKNEGQLLLLCAGLGGVACTTAAGRWRPVHALWLLPALIVLAGHTALNTRFGFVNDLVAAPDGSGLTTRILHQAAANVGQVAALVGEYALAAEGETRLLVAAFLTLMLLFPRCLLLPRARDSVAPDRSAWNRTALLAMGGFLLVFLGSPHEVGWHVRWSLPRLMFQLLPVLVVSIGAASTWLSRGPAAPRSPTPQSAAVG